MDFADLVRMRRSVRAYAERPVSEQEVETCLEAARRAPSACNAQPWHFVVIREGQTRKRLGELSRLAGTRMNRFVGEAPVIVAITAERPNITSRIGAVLKKKPYYLMDIGMAAEHLCLQAAELGLGTCMIGWFDEPEVRSLLGVSRGLRVALLVTLGRPADEGAGGETAGEEPRPRRRKDLSRIASRERYGEAW